MAIMDGVGDGIKGERIVCEYGGPKRLRPNKFSGPSGHRLWRIKLNNAVCIIEKKYRWLAS